MSSYSEGLNEIPVARLQLDPHNPRLPQDMQDQPERDVIKWMLNNASLTDLMASVVENSFFGGEPLVGMVAPDGSGNVVIVEGNRRLAAVKLLHTPESAGALQRTVDELAAEAGKKGTLPEVLPVYIVANREAVETYLGFRHISGVRPWPVIAKARYLYSLYLQKATARDVYRLLAKEIGSKPVYVRRLVIGYQLFEHIVRHGYYDEPGLSEESFDLSLINDAATRHSNIAAYMGIRPDEAQPLVNLNDTHFQEVFRWLYARREDGSTRLGEGRNLPLLNRILGDEKAKAAFVAEEKISIHDAVALTDLADETMRSHLQTALAHLLQAQKYVHKLKAVQRSDRDLADELASLSLGLSRSIFEQLNINKASA